MHLLKIFFAVTFIFSTLSLKAQTPIELHITHKLGGVNPFSLNQPTKNDLGNDFKLSRVEYYISKISIKHDGGTVTQVPNHYILVNGNQDLTDQLGNFNITNVESISFYIGVDSPINHADPSLQPNGHPLAPKSPSMHWGWSSGYRFVAIEGMAGSNLDRLFELHGLFNQNYFEQTITVTGVNKSGKIIIPIYADYVQALKGINLTSGVVSHGLNAEDAVVLNNFRDNVFKAGNPVSVTTVNNNTSAVKVYPNPSKGNFSVLYESDANVEVYDLTGRLLLQKHIGKNTPYTLHLEQAGIYTLKIITPNQEVIVRKIEVL